MSQLEPRAVRSKSERSSERMLALEGGKTTVAIPENATPTEAAAVAAAVGAHLNDRRRAALAAADAEDSTDRVDEWVLAARMRSHGRRHWPRDVERGGEWRAAARSF